MNDDFSEFDECVEIDETPTQHFDFVFKPAPADCAMRESDVAGIKARPKAQLKVEVLHPGHLTMTDDILEAKIAALQAEKARRETVSHAIPTGLTTVAPNAGFRFGLAQWGV